MIRTIIVDDHPILRDAIAKLISEKSELEFNILGMAGSAKDALSMIKTLKLDMIILGISLEGMDGIELIKTIRTLGYNAKILVLSMYDELLYAERALEAGADGYVMKHQEPSEILNAICTVAKGNIYFSSRILIKVIKRRTSKSSDSMVSAIHSLSDRELETFRLLGLGWKTDQIADELHISSKTVQVYYTHIKRKLNYGNFNELIAHAALWVISYESQYEHTAESPSS